MALLSSDLIRQGAAGASTGYTIDNSYFNSAISRSFMTADTGGSFAGNKTFTYSFWTKKINDDAYITGNDRNVFLGAFYGSNNRYDSFQFNNNQFEFISRSGGASTSTGSAVTIFKTNRVFRDVAAWYHFVLAVDTTKDTPDERVRFFVNGERETDFGTENIPSKDTLFYSFGDGVEQNVGTFQDNDYGSSYNHIYYDGYFAEFHGLDGYAYDASYFGEFDDNGIWIPKEYSESYGTHGFYLEFKDSSSLGSDTSGQNNDFTLRNIGSDHQSTDTPTNNKITFNAMNNQRGGGTVDEGAMRYVGPGTRTTISTTGGTLPTSGKWAVAISAAQVSTDVGWSYGLQKADDPDMGDAAGSNEDIGAGTDGAKMIPSSSDGYYYDYEQAAAIDPSLPLATDDEHWLAVDIATGKYWFGIYDTSAGGYKWVAQDAGLDGDPGAGSNETGTLTALQNNTGNYEFVFQSKQTNQYVTLLREADLSGAVPTGFTYWENVRDLI